MAISIVDCDAEGKLNVAEALDLARLIDTPAADISDGIDKLQRLSGERTGFSSSSFG
jgi:hypothetical protein